MVRCACLTLVSLIGLAAGAAHASEGAEAFADAAAPGCMDEHAAWVKTPRASKLQEAYAQRRPDIAPIDVIKAILFADFMGQHHAVMIANAEGTATILNPDAGDKDVAQFDASSAFVACVANQNGYDVAGKSTDAEPVGLVDLVTWSRAAISTRAAGEEQ